MIATWTDNWLRGDVKRRTSLMRKIGIVCILLLISVTGVASALTPMFAIGAIAAIGGALALGWIQFNVPAAVLLISSSVDILIHFDTGAVSLMGAVTIVVSVGSWLLWLVGPIGRRYAFATIWPMILYGLWSLFSASALYRPGVASIQNLLVTLGFIGLILLSASESGQSPVTYERVGRLLGISTWVATALYVLRPILGALDPRFAMGHRSFALFALLGLAWFLAESRYGASRSFLHVALVTLLIVVSLSRTAMAVAGIIFIISRFSPSKAGGWVRFFSALGLVTTTAYLAVTRIDAIRDRFVQGDVSMTVGGFSFNAEGRTEMWKATEESFLASPWIGNGIGSATHLIQTRFPGLGHPHNDYLRILHDLGILGMVLWLAGTVLILWIIGREWLRLDRQNDPRARIHLAAFLTIIVILLTMVTDNVVVYAFVMFPAAVIIGTSIGSMSCATEPDRMPLGSATGTQMRTAGSEGVIHEHPARA